MPEYGQPGGDQRSQQKFLVFDNFEKMNTQAARTGLPEKQLAWLENLQPIAENKLLTVPAPATSPFVTLSEIIRLAFYTSINGQDYAICFTTVGGGWFVNFTNRTSGQFAPDGTFSNAPDCTSYLGERVLINDSQAGYCTWDGNTFIEQGNLSPNILVTNGGFGYGSPPTVTISPTPHGATAVATVSNGQVTGITLTNPGTGWQPTGLPTISFSGGVGSGATFVANMGGSHVSDIQITNSGAWGVQSFATGTPIPLNVAGGGGSGAAATGTITAFPYFHGVEYQCTSAAITAGGSGYTSRPLINWNNSGFPLGPGGPGTSQPANYPGLFFPTFRAIMADIPVASVTVTAGGSGYPPSTTIPLIFTGGNTNATGFATTNSSGVVISATVTAPGDYTFGVVAGVQITVGSGAAAIAKVWPFVPAGTTLAVFQGRVWLGGGQLLQWTGTGANFNPGVSYDDFDPANAAGSLQITDADLVHSITALRSLNNYLWVVGDQSVKQIGNISISSTTPPVTLFTILTLSSDQGTAWPKSCISYNRIFLFANPNGIFGVFGSTVQKVSDDLDGIFQNANFAALPPQGAVLDLNSKHNAVFLLSYNDPVTSTTRALLVLFDGKRWWLANQGTSITTVLTFPQPSPNLNTLWATRVGQDLTQLFAAPTVPVSFRMQTAMSYGGNPVQAKRVVRAGFTSIPANTGTITMELDGDVLTTTSQLGVTSTSLLVGGANDVNNAPISITGIYLGATLTGTAAGLVMQNVIVEYQETALWKSQIVPTVVLSIQLSASLVNLPAMNAGDFIGTITVTTSPPGGKPNTPITLGGPDATKFAITNGGIIPCNLVVGSSNIAGGSYSITLTAS